MFVDFGMAKQYGGNCYLRFDDTNPEAEKQEYIDHIQARQRGWLPLQRGLAAVAWYAHTRTRWGTAGAWRGWCRFGSRRCVLHGHTCTAAAWDRQVALWLGWRAAGGQLFRLKRSRSYFPERPAWRPPAGDCGLDGLGAVEGHLRL